jgi:hypothetical protein
MKRIFYYKYYKILKTYVEKLSKNILNFNRQRYIVVKSKKESAGWGSQIYNRQSYPGGLITRRAVSTLSKYCSMVAVSSNQPPAIFRFIQIFQTISDTILHFRIQKI